MQITFLVGNGFDIGIGMQSRFKDFFPIYQAQSQNKKYEIKKFADEIGSDYETWADFETALGKYTKEFTLGTKHIFIKQLRDFEIEFIEYLKKQESGLSFKETNKIAEVMINALTKYYSINNIASLSNKAISEVYSNHAVEHHVYNFVNFNYTSVLEKCLKTIPERLVCKRMHSGWDKFDKVGQIIHVHGRNDMYPIIGVNDVSQIANKALLEDHQFAQYIVKPSLNQLLRQENDENTTNLINQSTIICVYGMSMGSTDKKWWELLLLWLHGNSERQLVLFDYDDKFSYSIPFDWIDKEDQIIDKLTQYNTDLSVNVEDLRPRIHIAVHKNIFQMNLTQDPEKNKPLDTDKLLTIA